MTNDRSSYRIHPHRTPRGAKRESRQLLDTENYQFRYHQVPFVSYDIPYPSYKGKTLTEQIPYEVRVTMASVERDRNRESFL